VGYLSGFFSRNWTLKLSAFGIALLLWVAVRAEAPNRQELTGVPVRVELADPQWALVGDPTPTTVTVRFGGPSRELIRLALERPTVVIPLEEVMSGDTVVLLRNAWVRLQDRPGVIAEDIQPSSVRLTLEPVERADLPPAPRWEGDLPDHLAFTALPVIEPPLVRISGPRSRLLPIDSIPLRPVDLSQVTGSGRIIVEVDTSLFPGLEIQPTSLEAEVVVEDRVERMISGIPVVLPEGIGADGGFQLRPATGAVLISGARSAVERADPTTFRLVLEVEAGGLPPAGDEAAFPIRLAGLPPLLEAEVRIDGAILRNTAEGTP